MNIFATSSDPRLCAIWLDNRRVVKMCLETAQLLCTTARIKGFNKDSDYKATHKNHPVSVWVRSSYMNFMWTNSLLDALCAEYKTRYGRNHACSRFINSWDFDYRKHFNIIELTPFQNSARNTKLNLDFTALHVHDAYKAYLVEKWKSENHPWSLNPPWNKMENNNE